ncbi:MAG: hypothetical protein CMM39_07260 [Rhodospirillaceae bacterium]|nr:hypothetical protein [Rhodospirillaceae bacterium]
MEWISDPAIWASLLTLTMLEIVLGIDNVIFVSIVANKLPEVQRGKARGIGLSLALILRLVFLSMLAWLIGLTNPLFMIFNQEVSWRDLILLSGGLFLIYKGTVEIREAIKGECVGENSTKPASFGLVIAQIIVLDLVFSIDSVVTAIGMAQHLWIMITAVIIAMAVMVSSAKTISDFISKHPTAKMLALSFLVLVGIALVADGLHYHIPRNYLYLAFAFSSIVEILNLLEKRRRDTPTYNDRSQNDQ